MKTKKQTQKKAKIGVGPLRMNVVIKELRKHHSSMLKRLAS